MFYITGDPHRHFGDWLPAFCQQQQTTKEDVLIILGDAGINYYGASRDDGLKALIEALPITLLCIHGNHENRASNIPTYEEHPWRGGVVYREALFPSILFARDGEVYDLDGVETLVIGGAYSVDKMYRYPTAMIYGYGWWPDEQPSEEIRARVEKVLAARSWQIGAVLTHTAALKYEPVEVFLSGIDQSRVDKSTEEWLDAIEEKLDYGHWYCGHYHTDKDIDRVTFLMFEIRGWLDGKVYFDRRPKEYD